MCVINSMKVEGKQWVIRIITITKSWSKISLIQPQIIIVPWVIIIPLAIKVFGQVVICVTIHKQKNQIRWKTSCDEIPQKLEKKCSIEIDWSIRRNTHIIQKILSLLYPILNAAYQLFLTTKTTFWQSKICVNAQIN